LIMRILTLSNCPLEEHQGSGYVILNFARGLERNGHQVDLFGPEHFEPLQRVKRAKSYRQAGGMLFFALSRLVVRHRYDIVEFYGAESCLAAASLAKMPRRSFLMVAHSNGLETFVQEKLGSTLGSFSPDGSPLKWYQSIGLLPIQKAFTRVDAIVVVSECERRYAIDHGYQKESRIAAIDNALPPAFLGQQVSFERPRVIGYCGGWLARKGARLIETDIPRVLREYPDCRFKMVGVGRLFAKQDHFPADVLDRIDIVPFVESKDELREQYRSMAILIVPSVYESFGLVTAEGMACGCAVVAGKTGFADSLRHKEEAFLLDETSHTGLYDALTTLLTEEPTRRRIAHAGYERVQRLRWPEAIDRLEELYKNWLSEFRHNRSSAT
jgi:glycosyltransferase involved in cell wall biosynthesis